VTTPPLVKGQTFTVNFPTAGNFKLVCLVHQNMTGVVHVLDSSQPLPHAQSFYDLQAAAEGNALLSDNLHNHQMATRPGRDSVTVGVGEVVANGGGTQTLSVYAVYGFNEGDSRWGNRGVDELRPGHTAHHHVWCRACQPSSSCQCSP